MCRKDSENVIRVSFCVCVIYVSQHANWVAFWLSCGRIWYEYMVGKNENRLKI